MFIMYKTTHDAAGRRAAYAVLRSVALRTPTRCERGFSHQVTQLSLTNPRDALHHDKRQKFLQSRDHNHTTTHLLLVICHSVARIDIAYLCIRFDDFRFSRSSDMI